MKPAEMMREDEEAMVLTREPDSSRPVAGQKYDVFPLCTDPRLNGDLLWIEGDCFYVSPAF